MNTVSAILRYCAAIGIALGLLSLINAAFDLDMQYKGAALPNDFIGALIVLAVGSACAGLVWLVERRRQIDN